MADKSTIKLEVILEDVVVSIDSCEYPYFMVLHTETILSVYPLVLGRPWFATVDANIG
jgi:hypothetical protein